uniref:GM06804p n=1 Tax=Drosophila melanogaster TaxID=7227 RepID=Q95S73_DROME|nr:GM06804p [Drosophila melanogaster]
MRLPGQSICICICMCISACIFICTFRPCVHVSATVSASVSVAIAFAARARLAMPESNSKRRQSGVVTPTKQSDCQ